jgi:hypothetical protein
VRSAPEARLRPRSPRDVEAIGIGKRSLTIRRGELPHEPVRMRQRREPRAREQHGDRVRECHDRLHRGRVRARTAARVTPNTRAATATVYRAANAMMQMTVDDLDH